VTGPGVTVVVPTVGRPSLAAVLDALPRPLPAAVEVLVVDDRPDRGEPLAVPGDVTVVAGPARGPAGARNAGWRAARQPWVAFLDDDVRPGPDWLDRLAADLAAAPASVGGVQGVLRVPLPADRRPTDWERVTAGLTAGRWITADMAYRRAALAACGGFDERLPRAFREDAEVAYRVRRGGWALSRGTRTVTHPVRPEDRWVSVRNQRGNADDALLRRMYGRYWRTMLEVPPGRRPRHAAITAAGVAAAAALAARRPTLAALAGLAWAAGTAEFAAARIVPGPWNRHEVATMLATSAVIPPVATAHWLRGWWRWRYARPLPAAVPRHPARRTEPAAGPAAEPAVVPAAGRAAEPAAVPAAVPAGGRAAEPAAEPVEARR